MAKQASPTVAAQTESIASLKRMAEALELRARISEARLRDHKAKAEYHQLVAASRAAKRGRATGQED